jgi:hypothetical protein
MDAVKINSIRANLIAAGVFFREHAVQKMAERNITKDEILSVLNSGQIIEEYPNDKYGPTCLVHGVCDDRQLHVLVSCSTPVWVITAYIPDREKWQDFKVRRAK